MQLATDVHVACKSVFLIPMIHMYACDVHVCVHIQSCLGYLIQFVAKILVG
jgi:hypothetical protein